LSVLSFSLSFALLVGRFKTPVAVLTSLFLPFIFFLSLVAFAVSAGGEPGAVSPLMTAGLASHIFLTFLGFSFFTMGFGVAVAFWIQEGQLKQHQIKSWSYRLPALEILDELTVFYISVGFLFWLAGLGLGAVEAYKVWQKVPFEDPKILGSFLVLVIYACFFLFRWGFKVRGRKSMTLVMIGYFLALFTFVGVRLFLTTQHTF
jgi:HemX protein